MSKSDWKSFASLAESAREAATHRHLTLSGSMVEEFARLAPELVRLVQDAAAGCCGACIQKRAAALIGKDDAEMDTKIRALQSQVAWAMEHCKK